MLQQLQKQGVRVVSNPQEEQVQKFRSQELEGKLAHIDSLASQLEGFHRRISENSVQARETYQNKMDSWLKSSVKQIRSFIQERCNLVKRNNGAYWNKIRKWVLLFE